jgi:hypothetical protein
MNYKGRIRGKYLSRFKCVILIRKLKADKPPSFSALAPPTSFA